MSNAEVSSKITNGAVGDHLIYGFYEIQLKAVDDRLFSVSLQSWVSVTLHQTITFRNRDITGTLLVISQSAPH